MNPLGRGGALWLLGHELRLALRSGKGSRGWRIFGLMLAAALALLMGGLVAAGLMFGARQDETLAFYTIISLAVAFAFVMALFWGVFAAVEALYQRKDLDLLFSSPLDPRAALTVRAVGVAGSSALVLLSVSLSATVWLLCLGQWRAAAIGPFAVGLAALAGATALSLSLGLFRTLGPRRTRTFVTVGAAVIGGCLFLALQTPNFLPPDQRNAVYGSVIQAIVAAAPPETSPLWWPARAVTGEPLALAGWLLVTIGSFVLVVMRFGRRFGDDAAAIAGMDGRPRRAARRAPTGFSPNLAVAVLAKELRLLRRDPALVANLLMQLVYLSPILVIGFLRIARGGENADLFEAGLAATLALFAGIIAGMITWIMVSAEDAPDLIASAPQARAKLDRLKAIASLAPTLALVGVPIAALAVFSPAAAGWAAFWSIVAAGANAAIYTRHQRPMPRTALSTKQKAPLVITITSGFINSMWSAAAGLCVSGLAPVALIPALIGAGLATAVLDMATEAEKPSKKPA